MTCKPFTITKMLGKKWNIMILGIIAEDNNAQFNTIKKIMRPITSKVLAARLKELLVNKMIEKKESTEENKTKYLLTKEGKQVMLQSIKQL